MQTPERMIEDVPEDLDGLLDRGFRFALSLTHDSSDAEDLIQDAVTAMLTKGASWHPSYLFATIRNRFIDGYRRKQNLKFVSLESEMESVFADASQPLDTLDTFESAQLHCALGALRADESEALFLAVVEGFTAEEIAQITRRPRGTVLSLIYRAKRKLRAALEWPVGSVSNSGDCAGLP
ncbi:MAG: RNA polymerase sigma factor [Thermoanaerobaculia bacterium]